MAKKFDDKTRKEMRQSFDFIDTNKDGYISKDELKQMLINMGQNELATDEILDEMIKMADTDKDGRVNFEEFLNVN